LAVLDGQVYEEGQVYLYKYEYIDYLRGNMTLIISVPYVGDKKPEYIDDRELSGCLHKLMKYICKNWREYYLKSYMKLPLREINLPVKYLAPGIYVLYFLFKNGDLSVGRFIKKIIDDYDLVGLQ
jgi:hypothetical protein